MKRLVLTLTALSLLATFAIHAQEKKEAPKKEEAKKETHKAEHNKKEHKK
ncbi:hypothetical protein LEP1GSC047_1100 [Leptospira inadai serovar Lyme str. 10]|uniref:Lipoprotein n=1 Tax=Leptospira inadai serovar Lyme str. 10 TaxID=1049790 RepID=V6H8J9_9LEPT|nr:hypothetical protein [Leptospira inadai]EQA35072.1 hypothetical protein LEP1GSC047_1100 [Leptospira inadai serovar Lyme str. 10]